MSMSKEQIVEGINTIIGEHNSAIARDLKLNLKKIFENSALDTVEASLALLALSRTLELEPFQKLAREVLKSHEISDEIIGEAEESAAIMGMLNIYYRFRHFMEHASEGGQDEYGPAKLRMQSLGNPQMGKARFEMLSFAVSAINGCEKCVTSHEKALRHLEVSVDQIHDLARLAAVTMGIKKLLSA
jgi:alkyl hydroperoxide reductase subunit D